MGRYPSAEATLRNPITGIAGCCARAASGHATAPPSRVILQEWLRDGEAECFRGLEIDNEFELVRQLHWQIARLGPLEEAINVGRRLTILVDQIHSVGDKSAAASKETIGVDSRQHMPRRQRDDEVAMENGKGVRHHDQGTVRLLRKCVYGALDLVTAAHLCQ